MFKDDCQKAKLTPDRDLSVMFSDYPLTLRRCLNFKSPLQMFFFGRVSSKQSYYLPLMKPYFTPGGWHQRRPKLTYREKANDLFMKASRVV